MATRPHLFLAQRGTLHPYKAKGRNRPQRPPRPANPQAHGQQLSADLAALKPSSVHEEGILVEFQSQPGFDLKLDSLETKKGIELRNVRGGGPGQPQLATVFIPLGQVGYFLERFDEYAAAEAAGSDKHLALVDSIETLRAATVRALWTDEAPFPADDQWVWWETWLRRTDDQELARLDARLRAFEGRRSSRVVVFRDRVITLVFAQASHLSASRGLLHELAELRQARILRGDLSSQSPRDQADWVNELLQRTTPATGSAPYVCLLDTGVMAAHPLLRASTSPEDLHSAGPGWPTHDTRDHGTGVAALALYGDLAPVMATHAPVTLKTRLESVTILPPPGAPSTTPDLYGAVMTEAVSHPEAAAQDRRRVFGMTATDSGFTASSPAGRLGEPSSWSAVVDALACGRVVDPNGYVFTYSQAAPAPPRLFVLSAGNVQPPHQGDHLSRSDLTPVEDPAQAWNALTIGGHTELVSDALANPHAGSPLAPEGELSPLSTTGMTFATQWPNKPDVLCEAGNLVQAGNGPPVISDDLSPLTAIAVRNGALVGGMSGTSASVGLGLNVVGTAMAAYPDAWPETLRALVVHSARWTPAMQARMDDANKTERARLLRRYGYGVASSERVVENARNAFTLVVQDELVPFRAGKYAEMKSYQLPWPKDVLLGLGGNARLRVTLSYFIEPRPGRRSYTSRYIYRSHGLQFVLRRPNESESALLRRVSAAIDAEEGPSQARSTASDSWFLGQCRNKGSVHSDVWTGTCASIADLGGIVVHPVVGWWKAQSDGRRGASPAARFALVVSVETELVEIDLWNAVANLLSVPVTLG